jgi:hypothetical protein
MRTLLIGKPFKGKDRSNKDKQSLYIPTKKIRRETIYFLNSSMQKTERMKYKAKSVNVSVGISVIQTN